MHSRPTVPDAITENEMAESSAITIEQRDGVVLVTVGCERMEDKHARSLQAEVEQTAKELSGYPVVVDMSRVEQLASLSIGALVTLWQKFKQDGRRFILVGLNEDIRETLTLCRLDTLFEICESVDKAMSRVQQ